MIDLHTHTTASDGTFSPAQLVGEANRIGLDALAITDHDTFEGYEEARAEAQKADLALICGIELSTKLFAPGATRGKTVHLLGYFLSGPGQEFLEWIKGLQQARHERNVRLAARLQELGFDIRIEEVKELGRSMAGRPHFARLMVDKKYVQTTQEAFDKYLDEKGEAYVDKLEPALAEGIRMIREGGGIASLAHPVRLNRFGQQEEDLIRQMAKMGMQAIEVYHSDHSDRHVERYQFLAQRYKLAPTGGSDFHGENKLGVELGTGKNRNVSVPKKVLDRLRSMARG